MTELLNVAVQLDEQLCRLHPARLYEPRKNRLEIYGVRGLPQNLFMVGEEEIRELNDFDFCHRIEFKLRNRNRELNPLIEFQLKETDRNPS